MFDEKAGERQLARGLAVGGGPRVRGDTGDVVVGAAYVAARLCGAGAVRSGPPLQREGSATSACATEGRAAPIAAREHTGGWPAADPW